MHFPSFTEIKETLGELRRIHCLQQGKGKRRYFHHIRIMEKFINNGHISI